MNRDDLRAILGETGRDGQQQGAGSGNDDALLPHVKARFHECLQASGACHTWQSPAGKRKEPFSRASGQNQLSKCDVAKFSFALQAKDIIGRPINDSPARPHLAPCFRESICPVQIFATVRMLLCGLSAESSPDLTAGIRVVIDQAGALAGFGGSRRSGDSARARSNNNQIKSRAHSVTTSIAGAHSNWQVR